MHCGAACPAGKLGPLLDLLRPEGGLLVTPVEPSDLRVILKKPDGSVTSSIISQVRYSTLEVRSMLLNSYLSLHLKGPVKQGRSCRPASHRLASCSQPGVASIWSGNTQRQVQCIRRLGVGPGVVR